MFQKINPIFGHFRALNFFKNPIAASPQKSFKRKKNPFFKNYKKKRNDEKPLFTKLSEIETEIYYGNCYSWFLMYDYY